MTQSPFQFSVEENSGTLSAVVNGTGEIVEVDKALAAAAAFDDVVPVGMLEAVRQVAADAVEAAQKAAEARFAELKALVAGDVTPAKARAPRARKAPARPKAEETPTPTPEPEPVAAPTPAPEPEPDNVAVVDIVEPAGDELPPLAEAPDEVDEAPDFDAVANFEEDIASAAPWAVAPTGIGPDDEF